jgi:hypothetical protein
VVEDAEHLVVVGHAAAHRVDVGGEVLTEHPADVADVGQDDVAGRDPARGGVVRRHGFRLGDRRGPGPAGQVDRLA